MCETDHEGLLHEGITTDYIAAQAAVPLAAEIVSSVLNLSVRRVTPLVGLGSVNLILFVETSREEIVVRLNKPEDDAVKVRGDYEKEQWCLSQASAAGIPSPNVLAVGEHSERAFMLQNRVPGVNGKQSGMAPDVLFQVLGRYARVIHALPANGFGDSLEAFENGNAREGWLRFVDYNLGELTERDPLLALGVYAPSQQRALREAFTWLRHLPLRIGLNHGDLARRNTIVDEKGRVSLLDWGCAEMHVVPHYDINALLHYYQPDHPHLHAFLEGYGMTGEEWTRLWPEVQALVLLKAFDLTRWAIDRCPARIEELAQRAHQWLSRYPESAA
ncbi:MAG: aminoglycoside phosphotransferase family protein [Chthonomonadales bacterium]|nr:aminoglycoside phosphotransferase family protein [Chthonomonadales bacterium]